MSYYLGEQFPVLGKENAGWCIPFRFVLEHAKQCQLNHYQTPQRLRERGGLSWSELYAVLYGNIVDES